MLHDTKQTISASVREGLDSAEPRDRAVHLLALKLAMVLDSTNDPDILRDLSPRLLAVLDHCYATPKSRATPSKVPPVEVKSEPESALARLRAVHTSGSN